MNIIFLTRFDPRNINNWSGTLYHIYNKLKDNHNIEIVGIEVIDQLSVFTRRNYSEDTFVPIDRYIRILNRLLSERIDLLHFDLIFFGDLLFVPYLDVDLPIVYLSDITYEQLRFHYRKPNEKQDKFFIHFERLLLEKSSRIIYSSEWAKKKAVDYYTINPDKIDIVEFGANIPFNENYSIDINMEKCKLVFIGKDWKRKGGDKLLQIYKKLKNDKFPCSLTIIGTNTNEVLDDDDLEIIPFLDKANPVHLNKLNTILSESHFLILPTQFDAFGIVFCEASAHALPSISADVGGVAQAIKEGKNGFLLSDSATAEDYAIKIKSTFRNKKYYMKLRASSRYEFETRLNWNIWGEKMNKILNDVLFDYNRHNTR